MVRSNLLLRVLTAIVLIPIVVLIVFYGNEAIIFSILSLIVLFSSRELFIMLNITKRGDKIFGHILNLFFLYSIVFWERYFLNLFVIIFFIAISYSLFIKGIDKFVDYAGKIVFSMLYIPFLLSYTYRVFLLPEGRFWLFFLLLTNWATDSLAYFVGIKIGKHKFSKISPKKSIEGLMGGVLGGIFVALLFNYFVFKTDRWVPFILLGFLGSVFGQISDLIESGIKRSVGVKDSGSLIPGHGGVLDRMDSIFFTGPLFYLYAIYIL